MLLMLVNSLLAVPHLSVLLHEVLVPGAPSGAVSEANVVRGAASEGLPVVSGHAAHAEAKGEPGGTGAVFTSLYQGDKVPSREGSGDGDVTSAVTDGVGVGNRDSSDGGESGPGASSFSYDRGHACNGFLRRA